MSSNSKSRQSRSGLEYNQITQELICTAYDCANAKGPGKTPEREFYHNLLLDRVFYYGKGLLKNRPRSVMNSDEDFDAIVEAAILEVADKYNPYEHLPTTYFQSVILEKGRKASSIMQPHYFNAYVKLNKVLEQWGKRNNRAYSLTDNLPANMTIRLSKATGIPLTTINKVIDTLKILPVSLPEDYDNYASSGIAQDPARIYEQMESDKRVESILENVLSPFERDVFLYTSQFYSEKEASTNKAVKYFNQADIYERYTDELKGKKIDKELILKTKKTAKERIVADRRFEKIMKLNPERCKNRYVMYETVEIVEFGTQEDFDNLNLDADYDD